MSRVVELFHKLGLEVDPQLLRVALTHRSFAYENGGIANNERLEFLGDAVLGVVVTEYLYNSYPDFPEGKLAKMRSAVVNANALADVARGLNLGADIFLGKGEIATNGADKASILADTLEAVIGAVMISAGRDAVMRFIHHLFDPLVDAAAISGAGLDWKTSLQELCAEYGLAVPTYLVADSGPDHAKRFEAVVAIDEWRSEVGSGTSKKYAEQEAAAAAFSFLSAHHSSRDA
ncbi:MAG: ribonuclease III [Propionibacteriaceae bacterium]|nr:ribonuclease III [Propionibacteriaceae bacterium]